MSSAQTPAGFSVEAFLTRIIPGIILFSPFLVSYAIEGPQIPFTKDTVLLLIGLGALIFGEVIDHVRSGVFRVPLPFNHMMYQSTGDERFLPNWYRKILWLDDRLPIELIQNVDEEYQLDNRLQFDMVAHMVDEFELDVRTASSRDFYDALILYLFGSESSRTKKARNAYLQNVNMKISTSIALMFYMYYIALEYPNPVWVIYLIAVIILIAFTFFISAFLTASPHIYVEMLEKEFYMDIISK